MAPNPLHDVLDVLERLLTAAKHPEIVAVTRYGPDEGPWGPTEKTSQVKAITGVKVRYRTTSTASLWGAIEPDADVIPVPLPETMPPPVRRANRLPIFVVQLLNFAQPPQFTAWQPVAFRHVGLEDERGKVVAGVRVMLADGTPILLHASATGVMEGVEPEEEPFPDYVIPEEEVRNACRKASAQSAAPR